MEGKGSRNRKREAIRTKRRTSRNRNRDSKRNRKREASRMEGKAIGNRRRNEKRNGRVRQAGMERGGKQDWKKPGTQVRMVGSSKQI
jgi:hypothetical protein